MADISTVVGPGTLATTTGTNAALTITIPPIAGATLYLDGLFYSMSVVPAALVRATIQGLITATSVGVNIPATVSSLVALVFGVRPIPVQAGQSLVVTLPALGSGVVADLTVMYHYTGQ